MNYRVILCAVLLSVSMKAGIICANVSTPPGQPNSIIIYERTDTVVVHTKVELIDGTDSTTVSVLRLRDLIPGQENIAGGGKTASTLADRFCQARFGIFFGAVFGAYGIIVAILSLLAVDQSRFRVIMGNPFLPIVDKSDRLPIKKALLSFSAVTSLSAFAVLLMIIFNREKFWFVTLDGLIFLCVFLGSAILLYLLPRLIALFLKP